MTDDASRVYGVGPMVEYRGRVVQVFARKRKHYAMVDAEILKQRDNPFGMLVQAAQLLKDDPVALRLLCNTVAESFRGWRNVSWEEYAEFIRSPRGNALVIWLAIRENDPEVITFDDVYFFLMEWFDRNMEEALMWRNEVMDAIDRASGTDSLGNSTGPNGATQADQGLQNDSSQLDSQKSMDSQPSRSESLQTTR